MLGLAHQGPSHGTALPDTLGQFEDLSPPVQARTQCRAAPFPETACFEPKHLRSVHRLQARSRLPAAPPRKRYDLHTRLPTAAYTAGRWHVRGCTAIAESSQMPNPLDHDRHPIASSARRVAHRFRNRLRSYTQQAKTLAFAGFRRWRLPCTRACRGAKGYHRFCESKLQAGRIHPNHLQWL